VEGSSRWQARGEVRNAAEVASECHGATEELGDTKEALDDGWRKLSTVVCSVVHDTEENRRGGSRPRSMAVVAGSERHTTSVLYSGRCQRGWPRLETTCHRCWLQRLQRMAVGFEVASGWLRKGGRRGERTWSTPDKATAAATYRQEAVAACGQRLSGVG
jgi:hypothetical protein